MLEQIDTINWESLSTAYGPATEVPNSLRSLANATTSAEVINTIFGLEVGVFHQGSLYTATPPMVRFLVEIASHPEYPFRARLLAFVYAITNNARSVMDFDPSAERSEFEKRLNLPGPTPEYIAIARHCHNETADGENLYWQLLENANPYLRMVAVALLTRIRTTNSQNLLERFETCLVSEGNPHVQATLLNGLFSLTPDQYKREFIERLEPWTIHEHLLVRYTAIQLICNVLDYTPSRYVPTLVPVVFERFALWNATKTVADFDDEAHHPIASKLYPDPPEIPSNYIEDAAPYPYTLRPVTELLFDVEEQATEVLETAYLHLLATVTTHTFYQNAVTILQAILKWEGLSQFDPSSLTTLQKPYLQALYNNIPLWADYSGRSGSIYFDKLGLPRRRDDWSTMLEIDVLPPSHEQAEAVIELLVRRAAYVHDEKRPLNLKDYERVQQLGLVEIGYDIYIPMLERLPNLVDLNLSMSKITATGIQQLPHFKDFRRLYLTGITLDKVAVERIVAFTTLTDLNLSRTQFQSHWITMLTRLTHLKYLTLKHNGLNETDIAPLIEALPDCRISL